jgi:hypothetical protein
VNDKKRNAEISTPFKLRSEMLDKVPQEFWKTPKKVFEPCCGKGGFVVDIMLRFFKGLKDFIPDKNERYRVIVEECLYFADINPLNIFVTKCLLDINNIYKLNYHIGDTLKLDIEDKWDLEGFDAVIGNPPYQNSCGNKGKGNTLWDKFVDISLSEWLFENSYLLFVHPGGWRQLDNKIGKLMLSKQILYLNMNDVIEGQKVFKCSTTFDYYLLHNTKCYKQTLINDYKNIEYRFDMKNSRFIPNHSIREVYKYIDFNNDNGIVYTRSSYGADKNWLSKKKDNEFKYPCVYSINKNNEISLMYSNTNTKGHFGVCKYIISNGCGSIKDIHGEYGCTQWSYYIKCDIEDMDYLDISFNNEHFLNLIDAVKLTSNKYNYVILKYLKKDFWKDFI